jgi:SAM-dependent methyltransferase
MPGDEADRADNAPSSWIVRFARLVPPNARVLDLACGRGRHSRLFATRGCRVCAVDRDTTALAALAGTPGIKTLAADLEAGRWPLADERFDAVVVTRYLHRPRLQEVLACVADDGVLLYETFARGNEVYGKPANPDFLLAPDELLAVIGDRLRLVAFEQGVVTTGRPAVLQRIAAVGRERGWPIPLPP